MNKRRPTKKKSYHWEIKESWTCVNVYPLERSSTRAHEYHMLTLGSVMWLNTNQWRSFIHWITSFCRRIWIWLSATRKFYFQADQWFIFLLSIRTVRSTLRRTLIFCLHALFERFIRAFLLFSIICSANRKSLVQFTDDVNRKKTRQNNNYDNNTTNNKKHKKKVEQWSNPGTNWPNKEKLFTFLRTWMYVTIISWNDELLLV